MTIDEAIADNLRIAEGQDKCAEISVSEHAKERISKCATEHRQLAEWLKELKEAKKLLKAAINDIYKECSCNTCGCDICENNRETCDYDDRFTWRHKAAVLKLIGETNDEP